MIKQFKYSCLLIALLAVAVFSCKKKQAKAPVNNTKDHYLSINQFLVDEWNTFAGEPFMIRKTVTINGKVDSSLTNSDTISWAPIIKTFAETDIGDPKFLGEYNYNQFPDNTDGTRNLLYEANEDNDDLFTKKLLFTLDPYTNKVLGIYVETEKKTVFDDCVQKLYYAPLKTVQIQTEDKPLIGAKTHTVVQYDFVR